MHMGVSMWYAVRDMDKQRFKEACEKVADAERERWFECKREPERECGRERESEPVRGREHEPEREREREHEPEREREPESEREREREPERERERWFGREHEREHGREHVRNGIGTLGEKTLHAVLKRYFEPDEAKHEAKVGPYYADIAAESGVIEIQTRALYKIKKKLSVLLEAHAVTVVYPVPGAKWLIWVDAQTGEATKRRKSPKQGKIGDALPELYGIKDSLLHPGFRLCVVLVDVVEYRYLDGWSKDKKRGSTRCDRVPVGIADEVQFSSPWDYCNFIPSELGSRFTTGDYKLASNTTLSKSQAALNTLFHVGAVRRVGKQGNSHIYERAR